MPSDTYTLTISDLGVAAVADNAVTTAKIADANVTTVKIADSNVTTAKIAAGAVTDAKLATDSVIPVKIQALAVQTAKIADGAVTTAKITDGAVTSAKIAATTITDGNIATGAAIALNKLATGALPAGITVATAAACTGNAATATTATNLSGATAFTIPYQTAASATGYIPVGTSGQVLQSNAAAAPTWVTVPFGTVAAGGTGITSYATGDILYASVTNVLSKLPAAAAGNVLLSGATPSYGQVPLATHVSGTLPVINGGTGVTSSTGSGNNVLSTSPVLTTPNLGVPSAGTLTNCTGLPLAGVGIATGTFSWTTTGTTQVSVPVAGMTPTSKVFIQQYGTANAENHAYMTSTASGGFTVMAGGSITAGKTYNYLAIL